MKRFEIDATIGIKLAVDSADDATISDICAQVSDAVGDIEMAASEHFADHMTDEPVGDFDVASDYHVTQGDA